MARTKHECKAHKPACGTATVNTARDYVESDRGQVTIAIIVGLVTLSIIGALIYQSGILARQKSEKTIQSQTMTNTKLVPVRDYVQACLDLASKDALYTIGQQGGYLFKGVVPTAPNAGQGGSMPDFLPTETGGANGRYLTDPDDPKKVITYVIFKRENVNIANWLFSDTPEYPYVTFPMYRLEEDLSVPCKSKEDARTTGNLFDGCYHFDGIYGANLLPPIEKPDTQPLPDFLNMDRSKSSIDSIQYELETFIINHTMSCVDFSSLKSTNLEFNPGKASVNATFTNATVTIELHYPLNMTDKTTGMKLALEEWVSTVPVRLDYLHQVLDFAVSRESDTMLFFMSNLSTPDGSISPAMRKNVIAGSNDYIVTYTDKKSTIDGNPYEFRFAVHNRPPALYYINRTVKVATLVANPRGDGQIPDQGQKLQPGPMLPLLSNSVRTFTICASRMPSGSARYAEINLNQRAEGHVIEAINPGGLSDSICTRDKLVIPLFAIDPDEDTITFST